MAFVDSLNLKYTGITSLEALAYNINTPGLICSIIDAKNENCYYALYKLESGNYKELIEPTATTISKMLDTLKEYTEQITFVGDGIMSYKEKIASNIKNIKFAADSINDINSYSLALAGLYKLENNITLPLLPLYLKKPQAQRQLEENKMEIQINNMNLNDLESICSNLEKDFDDFWNYNILKNELQNPNSIYFVAKDKNNNILGFAGILKILDEADITNIVVKKDYRNKGIGTMLLKHLILEAKKQNLLTITLEVNEKNKNAILLYKKFKFEELGIRKKYYNNTDNAIIMTLNLKS